MISVIVPIYQAEKHLKKCIESILNQTFSDLELILVDDGSQDSSGNICDKYALDDSRVKVIHKINEGVSVARNTGLNIATGEYITFVDSDDYIELDMYERMYSKAKEYACDVVLCDCVKEYENRSVLYTHNIRPGYYNKEQLKKEYYPHLLIMENVEYPATISNWLLLFKRELHSGEELPRYMKGIRFSEDLLFGAQLLYKADSFYYMKEETLYHYWMNPNSVTHVFKEDKWQDYVRLHGEIKNVFYDSKEYDFHSQIDLVLLFFVYNSIADIINAENLVLEKKISLIDNILSEECVREMFHKTSIMKLPIKNKLKLLTFMYKYNLGIRFLINRAEKR